jgi:predicted small secreted protein
MSALRRTIVRTLACTLAIAALGALGCNTVKGVGKDVEGAGRAIQGD